MVKVVTISVAAVFTLIMNVALVYKVRKTFQAQAWILYIPFAVVMILNILYFIKSKPKIKGVISMISIPIQVTFIVAFFLYKFFVIFAMRPQFIFISVVFTLDEILIIVESMCPACFKTIPYPWIADLSITLLRGWDKINEWRGGPPVDRQGGAQITGMWNK